MNKEERIARYGEAAWEKMLAQGRERYKAHKEQENVYNKKYREEHPEEVKAYRKRYDEEHREEDKARSKKYKEEHPEEVKANGQEHCRKGGKRYDKHLEYQRTGISGDKNRIRSKHAHQYRPYKRIIAPDSQIHHEWIPNTAEYTGVALVEADQHQYGIIDVIQILEGKITLLTEEEVKRGKKRGA